MAFTGSQLLQFSGMQGSNGASKPQASSGFGGAQLLKFAQSNPTPKPQPVQATPVPQPQPNLFQQAQQIGNTFNTGLNDVGKNIGKVTDSVGSSLNNLRLSVANSNPVIKQLGDIFNQAGTGPLKGREIGVAAPGDNEATYSGNTPQDYAKIILDNMGALIPMQSGVVTGFSKSRAVVSAALQAGTQIVAGASPSEVIQNLPFGLLGGAKMAEEPISLTPAEAKVEVIRSDLAGTPLGKEIIKTSFQADKAGAKVQLSFDPSSNLKTAAGFPVKVEAIQPNSTVREPLTNIVAKNEELQGIYKNVPQTKIETFNNSVADELKNIIPEGSTPPELIDKTITMIQDGVKNLSFQDDSKYPAVNQIVNHYLDRLDSQVGVDTKQVRADIMDAHGKIQTAQSSPSIEEGQSIQNANTESNQSTKGESQGVIHQGSEGSPSENTTSGGSTEPGSSDSSTPGESTSTESNNPQTTESSNVQGNSTSVNDLSPAQTTVGEGTTRTSKLGLRVEQTAIDKKITTDLGKLPTYKGMNMEVGKQKAGELLANDPERAWRVIDGTEPAPDGIHPGFIFKAMEASITNGEQARRLAQSPLASETSELGQQIKAYDSGQSDSPVAAIKDVINAREKNLGKTTTQATTQAIKDIQSRIPKIDKYDWGNFIKSISCG